MAWGKAGSTTLGSAGDALTTTGMTASKFNQFMIHTLTTAGTIKHNLRFDNNSNTDYARRRSNNGVTDSTDINQPQIEFFGDGASDKFEIVYSCNISGEEKLNIHSLVNQNAVGVGSAPDRSEAVSKADITTNSGQYTRVDCLNTDGGGDYDTSSNLSILGSEVTSSAGKPTNVQVGSRWEETDTRKIYHYEPQVADYDYPMTTDPRTNTFNSSLCTITHANSTLQMNQITNGGAGGSATYIDLGSNLSTKWVMRFKTKQTAYTSYAGNSQFQVGMSSVAPTSTAYNISSSLNWIGIRWYYGTQIWSGGSRVGVEPRINQNTGDNTHNNSTWNGSGNDQRLYGSPREVSDTTTPYYHEIIWNVDTFTYNLYTNANYTGTPAATATMSSSTNTQWVTGTPSSISGLRYFVFKMGGDSSMGVWVNQLDDVEIWDGVTVAATGNEWKEEGT